MKQQFFRGRIYYADLSPVIGSEQGGLRPVLVVQNDVGNRYSPTIIAVALTTRIGKKFYPTQVDLDPMDTGLSAPSRVLCEQIRTLDRRRFKDCIGEVSEEKMREIDRAIKISLGV